MNMPKKWEWRRGRRDDFPCCALALRFVFLSQISICSVEQVFLRLKLVEDSVEENTKNDMLELRFFYSVTVIFLSSWMVF